jgi:predicted TIM-barrel fold metal-dependent hydrolase
MSTRREFIRNSTLVAAAAALPLKTLGQSQATPSGASKPAPLPIPVDWHSHIITPGELKYLAGRTEAPRVIVEVDGRQRLSNRDTVSAAARAPSPTSPSDIDVRIRHLQQVGVQRQLLTYTVALGYDATLPIEEQRKFFRILNDDLAAVVRKHPDRFYGVAALPTADPKWAVEELKRAHTELGLIGAALPLNAFASLASAQQLAPIFAEAQKHRSHIFVHRAPANPSLPDQPALVIPKDTEAARWGLISNTHLANGAITLGFTDFLDPYPDVTVQVIMLGGFLPYLLDSTVAAVQRSGVKDPLARLRRVYFDPGPYSARAGEWVAYAASKIGADRILFGTDYGVGGGANGDTAPAIARLDEVLTPQQRQTIYVDNTIAFQKLKGLI